MVKFSLVICTRRRPVLLARCLSSVVRLKPAPIQIIVVDNTEGDEETKRVAAEFGAHYVVEPKAGLSRARKRGLAECKSDAVAYLDDGVIPDSNWLSALLASFARQKALRSTGKLVNITSSSREANQESSKDPVEGDSR